LGFDSPWLHMYKKFSKEEFEEAFDKAVEKAFENDIVGETGVTVVTESMTVHMSKQAYEEFKVDVIKGSLETDEHGQN
jgi:hypothetical protein